MEERIFEIDEHQLSARSVLLRLANNLDSGVPAHERIDVQIVGNTQAVARIYNADGSDYEPIHVRFDQD